MNLNVSAGEVVRAAHVRELARLARERTYLPGHNVRLRQTLKGVVVEAMEQRTAWHHMWEADLQGDRVAVSPGLVNGRMPWVDDGGGLRPMDGFDAKGKEDKRGRPLLRLREADFNAEGFSWIVVRVRLAASGAMALPEDGGLELVQSPRATWLNGGSTDVVIEGRHCGDYPLALLRRPQGEKGLGTLTQCAMFPLNHRFVAAGEGRPGTHFFWV